MRDGRPTWLAGLKAGLLVGSARLLLARRKPSEVLRLLAGGGQSGVAPRWVQLARRAGGGVARRTGAADASPPPGANGAADRAAAMRAVRRAGRVLRADCLPQSIALTALLQRAGSEPALILGCRRYGANDWGAHAWVEVDGQVLDPVEQPHHAQLARLVAAQNWEVGPAPR